jgi:hypothetical protein
MSLIVSNLSLGVPGGGGGITSIDVANTAFVDGANGNDGTAVVGRQDLPYATIGAALTAASSGQAVMVHPGTYAESGLTVAAGVRLVSSAGWNVTKITGAAATGTRVTLAGDGSSIEGFRITVPTDAAYGIQNTTGAGEVGSVFFCTFDGQAGSVGYGIGQTGAGKTVSFELRFAGGEAAGLTLCSSGILATQSNHIPGGSTLAAAWDVTGGRFQGLDLNVGSPTVTDALRQSGGVVRVFTANWFNVTNAIHFTGNTVDCSVQNGEIDSVTLAVLVDPALTLSGGVIRISANHQPVYSFPPAALGADFAVTTFQRDATTLDAGFDLFGVPLNTGFPELGVESRMGQGPPYTTGLVALSTDSTAGSTSDGGNFTDISASASSRAGSSFAFQGSAANHTLLFCSQRFDVTGAKLKHWGLRVKQITGAVGGSFVFEIWDGAAWVKAPVLATSAEQDYRYADQIFLRSSSNEDIRYGIDQDATWASKTINGVTGYWSRVRIVSAPSTPPVFEQSKLHPSSSITSTRGVVTAIGLAQTRGAIAAGGNIFGESGTVVTASQTVGTGGAGETWSHESPNSLLNSSGDAIYFQFTLPEDINTAHPVTVALSCTFNAGGAVTAWPVGIMSLLCVETSGVLVADPAGGIVPVKRTAAATDALTANAGQPVSKDLQPEGATLGGAAIDNQQHRIEFGPFDVSSRYAGDTVYCRFELDADGTPAQDVFATAVALEGVRFASGQPI